MKRNSIKVYAILFILIWLQLVSFAQSGSESSKELFVAQINKIEAFAKLYGYMRFFCPSDVVTDIDWNKFAVYGVMKIWQSRDNKELETTLKELFLPITPALQIYSKEEDPQNIFAFISKDNSQKKAVAWQHYGVWLSKNSNVYKSMRVFLESKPLEKNEILSMLSKVDKSDLKKIYSYKLFDNVPQEFEYYETKVDSQLLCKIPLTLNYDSLEINGLNNNNYITLSEELDSFDITKLTINNLDVRLANVIIVWNVIQHFFPYFDEIKIDWTKVLPETLIEVFENNTREEFYDTLRKMMAKLGDGHSYINFTHDSPEGGLPIRVDHIQNQSVVIATEDTLFKKGDIIKTLDGEKAEDVIIRMQKYERGSPQFKKFLALLNFGNGQVGSKANIEVIRESETIKLSTNRVLKPEIFFQTRLSEFNYPSIKKLGKGIYYINCLSIDQNEYNDSLTALVNANGIIFDFRWTSIRRENTLRFNPIRALVNLIISPVETPPSNIPAIVYPDRKKLTFIENQTTIPSKSPYINASLVFLTDPNVISYMETFLDIAQHNNLGVLIGGITAGTNGNVNHIPLLDGYTVMFTGAKILKLDGTQLYQFGIKPDYPVKRTIKAVKEGRDEYLEKAIEVIKANEK